MKNKLLYIPTPLGPSKRMKKIINNLQTIEPFVVELPKKYAVGHKLRQELSDMSDKLYENTFMSHVMDKASKECPVLDRIYDALRTKIEFTVTKEDGLGVYSIHIKDVFKIEESELKQFIDEMELNLREQYGTT
jgi:hypothetical protein